VNYLVVGASAGLGRALSYRLAEVGSNLIVVASDDRDLNALASDVTIRFQTEVRPVPVDMGNQEGMEGPIMDTVTQMGGIDGILCPIGAVDSQDRLHYVPDIAIRITQTNYLSLVSVITTLWPHLIRRPRAVVVGFGSIAATRGRRNNIAYSAAKRALKSFFESLRHTAVGTQVVVQYYVLGYLNTNLAFGHKTLLPKGNVDILSRRVVNDLHRDVGVRYYPKFWRLICAVLNIVPWSLFKRINY
jgi:short-subunit dehydrogenase